LGVNDLTNIHATTVIERLQLNVLEVKDNMLWAKISQSLAANKHRTDAFPFEKGSRVVLSMLHQHQDYKVKDEKWVSKFMPRFDGPYLVMETAPKISMVTIDLPNHPNTFHTFHTSQVRPFVENNKELFPSHKLEEPLPVFVDEEQFFVDHILDEHKRGRGLQYLVRWLGYGPEEDRWLPGRELDDCEVLNIWLAKKDLVASV
jgi:hypothetical protein